MSDCVPSLPASALIHRAIRNKNWVQGGRALPAAFFLRTTDNGKLSVLTALRCSPNFCEAGFNSCFGEITLKVESFNQLNLDVIHDREPDKPNHASVLNLPLNEGNSKVEAERIARQLARQVIQVRQANYKRPKSEL